jgi:monoamine oxidase
MALQFSRRRFLNQVGAAGGSAAVYQMALALGLTPGSAQGAPGIVRPLNGARRSVVLLGGGLSSLMSAYELERAGYQCTILEAAHRVGGRNLTLRSGDLVDEMGNQQRCEFDDDPHLYFNAGAARIPVHHHYLVHYCRVLGVELETFTNVNYNAWVHDTRAFGGKPVRFRRFLADARGFIAELSAKSVNATEIDAPLTAEDLDKIIGFLKAYGDLDTNAIYRGSNRGGYRQPGRLAPTAGMLEHGELPERLDFSEILKTDFWRYEMHFGDGEDQAAPLLQPKGGMDNIVKGFMRQIRSPVLTQAQVKSIRLKEDGVAVVYQHQGRHQEISADYCFNCIPKHLLVGIDNNFPAEYLTALRAIGRGKMFKIGIQMKDRFWERERIYGGISWTNQNIEQIWYPPHNVHGEKGVMLGAYTWDQSNAEFFARLNPQQRFKEAVRQGSKIHPDYGKHAETAVRAAWTEETRRLYFTYLQTPLNGRHFMMGDQISYHPGWQEGAFSSAHHSLTELGKRVSAELGGGA